MGLRPMRDGDDPRDIYWRRSTQPDQRLLRIRAEETYSDVTLTVNDLLDSAVPREKWLEGFERQIREVASCAVAHLHRGDTVRIRTASGDSIKCAPTSGADAALTFLALLECTPAAPDALPSKQESNNTNKDDPPPEIGPAPTSIRPPQIARPA